MKLVSSDAHLPRVPFCAEGWPWGPFRQYGSDLVFVKIVRNGEDFQNFRAGGLPKLPRLRSRYIWRGKMGGRKGRPLGGRRRHSAADFWAEGGHFPAPPVPGLGRDWWAAWALMGSGRRLVDGLAGRPRELLRRLFVVFWCFRQP